MAKHKLTATDRERFLRAHARGTMRASEGSAVVGARYDARRETLISSASY
jgi:hypothetical protein